MDDFRIWAETGSGTSSESGSNNSMDSSSNDIGDSARKSSSTGTGTGTAEMNISDSARNSSGAAEMNIDDALTSQFTVTLKPSHLGARQKQYLVRRRQRATIVCSSLSSWC
jgi:hypothetical protein